MMTCKVTWSVLSSSCLITWCHVIKHDEGETYHVNLHLITFVTSVFFPNPVGYSYTITHDSVPLKICFHIDGSYMGVVHSWTPTSYIKNQYFESTNALRWILFCTTVFLTMTDLKKVFNVQISDQYVCNQRYTSCMVGIAYLLWSIQFPYFSFLKPVTSKLWE